MNVGGGRCHVLDDLVNQQHLHTACDHCGPTPSRVTRVLVAEDDPVYALVLDRELRKWGYEVELYADGLAALAAMQQDEAPRVAIIDWVMPGLDGLELVRRLRTARADGLLHIIMLTGRDDQGDVVAGLEAGADDYLAKPAQREELRARLRNGIRTIELQLDLTRRITELEGALAKVKQLQGLLPICAYCKKVRCDDNYWQQVEAYVSSHSDLRFSHGICPSCYTSIIEPQLEAMEK